MGLRKLIVFFGCMNNEFPALLGRRFRQKEIDLVVVAIQEKQKAIVKHLLTVLVNVVDCLAVQQHTQTTDPAFAPFLVSHFTAIGPEPDNVSLGRAAYASILIEFSTPKVRMVFS